MDNGASRYQRFLQGEQFAIVLKKSVKQVNNLAYRAKTALRTILKEEDI